MGLPGSWSGKRGSRSLRLPGRKCAYAVYNAIPWPVDLGVLPYKRDRSIWKLEETQNGEGDLQVSYMTPSGSRT